ncbi:response regulator transcription factor [Aliihoeflea sp. 2WW]|uniref:response regulator transcription factor n=1 Tax=Aliihoeflea sp. 2WW TaxID=1381123 RepID=UPI0004657BA5|nr:response regulator transcription factor [Aliihoeflea sp. 2WW]
MLNPTNIVIIEQNEIYRAGLLYVLHQGGFENCSAISSLEELDSHAPAHSGKVLFLAEIGSDEEAISAGIEFINHACPNALIVIVSDFISDRQIATALRAGADGLVFKFVAPQVLTKSVELVLLGQPVFPMQVVEAMQSRRSAGSVDPIELRNALDRLSKREMEVLRYMCMGNANKVIARSAGISEATVKVHVKAILRKLGARNRTEAALWAWPHGLSGDAPRPDRGDASNAAGGHRDPVFHHDH